MSLHINLPIESEIHLLHGCMLYKASAVYNLSVFHVWAGCY